MSVLEEAVYLLAEWLATRQVQGSVAFPELVVPLFATLKKSVKKASGGKEAALVKGLLDRVEEGSKYISERRKDVGFGPKLIDQVRAWEKDIDIEESPMGKYVKSQRKLREKRKKLVEKVCVRLHLSTERNVDIYVKAREGEDEILDSE